jgi:hypothetical protein
MNIPPGRKNCVTPVAHKKIRFSGKQTSTLYLLNPSKRSVDKVQVDGCAITEGLRCDWAVEVNDDVSREEIFIELKGSHITDAVKQLEATIDRLSSDPGHTKKRCLIASARSRLTSTEIKRLQIRFLNEYNAKFKRLKSGSSDPL